MDTEKMEEFVKEVMTPDINNIIYKAIKKAVDMGRTFEAEHPDATARTISSYIHDKMCSEVERRRTDLGESSSRVILIKKYGTLKISIDNGSVIIRLKKMTRQGVTSNIVTQPVLDFEQMSLFPDESIKLNAGYCYTRGGVDYDVIISHPSGLRSVDWCQPMNYIKDNVESLAAKTPVHNSTGQKRKLLPRKDAVKHATVDKS